jgi:hypothetical protein
MTKLIALAVGMTGTFYGHGQSIGQRAEITRIWSETCVNLVAGDVVSTSVFVPPLGTPADRHPAGYYFLPDVFVAASLRADPIEDAIVQAGANVAPRVTPADIEHNIVEEHYFTARDGCEGACGGGGTYPVGLGLLTFCVLTLRNGFTVTGESACASPENFNAIRSASPAERRRQDLAAYYELRSKLAA